MKTSELLDRVGRHWAPPEELTVSQWADKFRKLSPEASAVPGQWSTHVVEYLREPMDMVGNPRVKRGAIMAAAQIAKSEFLLNVAGYLMDLDPCPMLMVQPTIENAEAFSKDRIAPMLRDTPALRNKIRTEGGRRGSDDTIKQKKFQGGYLTLVGANSPSSLASRPIRTVLLDEVDRYAGSAGDEGDPVQLATKRTATFWNRVIWMVSTPVTAGESRIEAAYLEGDQRQWWVPCHECGHKQTLKWPNVTFEDRQPESARYKCENCGTLWTNAQRIRNVRKGAWRPQKEWNGVVSYHIVGLMSPFASMADGVREFLDALGRPDRMKVWVNTYLGETFEEDGKRIDQHELEERVEDYETTIPEGVTVLTAGADVQDDRVEVEVIGWGDGTESWSIDYKVIWGDPSTSEFWHEVKEYLHQIWVHPLFGDMVVRATCIDTGGHYTASVYKFAKTTPRVFAIRGVAGDDKPIIGNPSKNNIGKVPLFPVGTFAAKDLVFGRLGAEEGAEGYCHFPAEYGKKYFEGLTSEMKVTRFRDKKKKLEYVKIRTRNEPLDCRVYGTAALELLEVDLDTHRRAKMLQLRQKEETDKPEPEDRSLKRKSRARKRKGGFVNAWKDG